MNSGLTDKEYCSLKLREFMSIALEESRIKRVLKDPLKAINRKTLGWAASQFNLTIPIEVRSFWGEKIKLMLPEISSLFILKFGFWEEDVATMIIGCLEPGMVFFDVGAHFGYFTMLGNKLVGKIGSVHSFEPAQYAFKLLDENVRNKNNCKINQLGVYSNEQKLVFNDYGANNSLYNSFYAVSSNEKVFNKLLATQYEVRTVSLDIYAEENNVWPDLVKIDAETAEYEVLKGMENIIEHKKPAIIFEIGGFVRDKSPKDKTAIEYLLSRNYEPYEYVKHCNLKKYEIKDEKSYKNILFLPKGRMLT